MVIFYKLVLALTYGLMVHTNTQEELRMKHNLDKLQLE
jgi:hypothetical protein